VNEFEIELVLRGPVYSRPKVYGDGDQLDRDTIMRLTIQVPREHAFEVAAVALEHGEEHGRFLGEMIDDPRFDEGER
jgi:hypothetical protein